MIPHRLNFDPRLCYRGVGTSAAAASRFVGLFNSSTAPKLLLVWDFNICAAAAAAVASYNQSAKVGALVMAGVPMMQGERAGAGQIFNGTDPASPTFDYQIDVAASTSICWWRDAPFAIIQPNQQLNISTQAGAGAITVSFIWQEIRPEELYAQPVNN